MLNPQYWRMLASDTANETTRLDVYTPVVAGSTLVLFSAENEPLAAATFLSAARACAALVTSLAEPNRAVALTSVDNARYSIVLTNLTSFTRERQVSTFQASGMLKIDILTEPRDVLPPTTDLPALALNAVNEVRDSESVCVACDQRAGSRVLKLRGATHESTGAAVSMDEDAAAPPAQRRGSRLYIHVTAARAFPELVAQLAGSYWRATDMIVRRIKRLAPFTFGSAEPPGNVVLQNYSSFEAQHAPFTFGQSQSMSRGAFAFNVHSMSSSSSSSSLSSFGARRSVEPRGIVDVPKSTTVGEAQAAIATVGERVVPVRSVATGVEYEHAVPGARLELALAVWRDLPEYDALSLAHADEYARMLIREAMSAPAAPTTLARVFKEDACAICHEVEPTHVIAQCGHQCLCADCVGEMKRMNTRKCVMCRAPIGGYLEAALVRVLIADA